MFCSLNKECRAWFLLCVTHKNNNYYYVCKQKNIQTQKQASKPVKKSPISVDITPIPIIAIKGCLYFLLLAIPLTDQNPPLQAQRGTLSPTLNMK